MSNTIHWIRAFRLRTLPLSLSSIFLGSFLASSDGAFNWKVLALAAVTTLFLQILSNLANDYGDSENGADNNERVGPARAVQSGAISSSAMRNGIIVFALLALASGIWLVLEGTSGLLSTQGIIFLLLGIGAIAAAIKYTVGKNPYGYHGFGDFFVFLFFGLTGVIGTYYLHTNTFSPDTLLPASALGMLASGVLNLNNMRDREADQRAGKNTLVVKIGAKPAKFYHLFLIGGAVLLAALYMVLHQHSPYQWLFLLTVPMLALNLKAVFQNKIPRELDPLLKKLALTTLAFSLTFGVGLIL